MHDVDCDFNKAYGQTERFPLLPLPLLLHPPPTAKNNQLQTYGADFRVRLFFPVPNGLNLSQVHSRCVFRDLQTRSWSSNGCDLDPIVTEDGLLQCTCNHLTNFAVLFTLLSGAGDDGGDGGETGVS